MPRERDYLSEACLLALNERQTAGRGAAGDDVCRALETAIDHRHVEAIREFADVLTARLQLRGRRLAQPNETERTIQ